MNRRVLLLILLLVLVAGVVTLLLVSRRPDRPGAGHDRLSAEEIGSCPKPATSEPGTVSPVCPDELVGEVPPPPVLAPGAPPSDFSPQSSILSPDSLPSDSSLIPQPSSLPPDSSSISLSPDTVPGADSSSVSLSLDTGPGADSSSVSLSLDRERVGVRVEGGRAGKTTLPWYLRHRVPAGFCLMAGPGAGEVRGLSRGDDWHFDIAFKGRLYGVAAGPVRVGLPCVYVGTSGVGAGVDLSLARAPLVSLDVGWFYPRNVIQAGVSVVVTPGP